MPAYTYKCMSCDHSFTLFLKMSQHSMPEEDLCPKCNKATVTQTLDYSTPIVDPYILGRIRQPEDWQSFMKVIKQRNPGSNIN